MKKKNLIKIIAVTAVSCMAMGIMTACDFRRTPNSSSTPSVELPQMEAPTNLKADFWDLTWDSVENSSGYIVRARKGRAARENYEIIFDGKETEETAFDLYPYLEPDELFTVEVKTKGDGETYADSEWTYVEYETEETTTVTYEKFQDGYMAKGSADFDGELVFRDTYDGLPVVTVSGFKGSAVERVRLPLSMTRLESEAFRDCVNLTEIKLPSTLLLMESAAFKGCTNLETIIAIDGFDYENCVLDGGVNILQLPSLPGLPSLSVESENIGVFEETKWLSLQGDKKFICWDKILYKYNGSMDGEVCLDELPDGIVNVAGGIFSNCDELTKVTVPKSWGVAYYKMFENCDNLSEVVLEDGITEIGEDAFSGNFNLQKVVISKDVREIEDGAFVGCKMTSIDLPEGLVTLGYAVFRGCSSLKTVELPNTLRGDLSAFVGSTSPIDCVGGLETIKVPEGITSVSFEGCMSLTSVELPESLEKINHYGFNLCKALKSLEIPDGVKYIGAEAFAICGIEELILPRGLKELASSAFISVMHQTTSVKKVYWQDSESNFLQQVKFFSYSIGSGREPADKMLYFPVYFYTAKEPAKKEDGTYDGYYWRYVDDKPTAWE